MDTKGGGVAAPVAGQILGEVFAIHGNSKTRRDKRKHKKCQM